MNSVLLVLNKRQSSAPCETRGPNIPRSSPQTLSRIVDCANEFKSQRHHVPSVFLRSPCHVGLVLGAWRCHLKLAI